MSALRVTSTLRRHRGIALLVATLCLGATVVLAHGAAADQHMGDGMAMCLAIVVVAGAAAAVAAGALFPGPRAPLRSCEAWTLPAATCAATLAPPARAGPALLQVFRR